MAKATVFDEVPGFYKIIPLHAFRSTPGVHFDILPTNLIPRVDGLDRVMHESGALSPGPIGTVRFPWYMHPHQDDNLMVFFGTRHVDIYTREVGRIVSFEVSPDKIYKEGKLHYDGPAMLVWPAGVFHRIRSSGVGSASLNLATRRPEFDIKTNFNIYDLDPGSGEYRLLREGRLDQNES
jgi:hypothetical protein